MWACSGSQPTAESRRWRATRARVSRQALLPADRRISRAWSGSRSGIVGASLVSRGHKVVVALLLGALLPEEHQAAPNTGIRPAVGFGFVPAALALHPNARHGLVVALQLDFLD